MAWRERIDARCNHRCVFCGTTRRLQYDHIHPISRGGLHVEENLQLACRLCNTSKGNRAGPTWMHAAALRASRKKGVASA